MITLTILKQTPYVKNSIKRENKLNSKLAFTLGFSVFLFFTLLFISSPQIQLDAKVYASSNNTDGDESNPNASKGNNDDDLSDQQNQQQNSKNDEPSDEVTSEEDDQCLSEKNKESRYVDPNGCHVPCPMVDDQTEMILSGCPQPKQQQQSETSNNTNDPSINDYNPDTNTGLVNSESIEKDTLKGKDVRADNIELAEIGLVIRSFDMSEYFGEEKANEIGKTILFCVETLTPEGNTIFANPHCLSGLNVMKRLQVEPGQIKINIQYSPQIRIDSEPKYCSIDHLEPKESKPCAIIFMPNSIQADIVPKPESNFGKSVIIP